MGIPKFFRWVSESLDMNGIIHNCSHPPSSEGDPHYRITEEQMILAIFAYIDHLFTKIKPKKVFFMAIDGVAPRAKMNQQRSRRFRTAREAKQQQDEAERKGLVLPEEKAFDSNCITPGTPFMARLSKHLKYFINKKISEDAEWQGIQVILSGHEVPGEGEHKIQEFISNPNTRHCLYGLDADLIMLGLLSHDPHFCLLREEVTFGRQRKKSAGLQHQNFFLLHLSLLREYLDLEFSSMAEDLTFDYDLERIIDDFILLSVFVGNDFLPHLPNLHINEGAMEEIWGIYKRILPEAGGYLNEAGTINLPRLQLVMNELGKTEFEAFQRDYSDMGWLKGKQEKEIAAMDAARQKGKLVMTSDQKKIFNDVKAFVTDKTKISAPGANLSLVNRYNARDRRFIQELADALNLDLAWDEVDDAGQNLIVIRPGKPTPSKPPSDEGDVMSDEDLSDEAAASDSDDDVESQEAIQRVINKYEKAKVVEIQGDPDEHRDVTLRNKMEEWKQGYYQEKLECKTEADRKMVVYKYVEGIQWVMNYYYKGVASWGWFYPYHYAPRISDFQGLGEMEFHFEIGAPFKPYQQLMGVLPAASGEHIPSAYRDLMSDPTSPIIDFYPEDFTQDMNGKKQEWEAVVKIPFIDEQRLLKAMAARDHRLTAEEQERNRLSESSTLFVFNDGHSKPYPSSLPGVFPDLTTNKCEMKSFDMPVLGDGIELINGLLEGVHLGASALAGFPSMNTLPHHAQLGFHGVNVHGTDSRNPSMVIFIDSPYENPKGADIAKQMVGNRTFFQWPFLHEAMVVAVSDDTFKYEKQGDNVIQTPLDGNELGRWRRTAQGIDHRYSKRFGIVIGHVDLLLHLRPLRGLKRMDTGALIKDYETADKEDFTPLQLAVQEVTFEDERYLEQGAPPLEEEYPVGSRAIFLGSSAYGVAAQVMEVHDHTMTVELAFFPDEQKDNYAFSQVVRSRPGERYLPSPVVGRGLGIQGLALSKITSSFLVELQDGTKSNIGLSIKYEAKGQKVMGYSRKNDRGWEYSQKAYTLLQDYLTKYPEVFSVLNNTSRAPSGYVKSEEIFPDEIRPDQKIKEVRAWLKTQGVLDLEPVTLFAEQLEKSTVEVLEKTADDFSRSHTRDRLKRARVQGIPRQAVLKPSHASFRLQGQTFSLGDRVIMVQDSAVGGVHLSMKGVVIGVNANSIDVVWDSPFIGGLTLGGRCSEHRGFTVPFSSCLNLTRKQFAVATGGAAGPREVGQTPAFRPRIGPAPIVPGQHFRPAANYAASREPSNGLRRAPRPQQEGPLQYGNAAKGIRPPPTKNQNGGPSDPQAKFQILRKALNGDTNSGGLVGGVLQAGPVQNPAPRPARSHLVPGQIPQGQPVRAAQPRPVPRLVRPNGAPANGAPVDTNRGRGRGRGGPTRGRGAPRGRGGHSDQNSAEKQT
ncbi:hypothetical protein QFC22_000094 [Naganishia vaughanmartiniae]|uniref:Uncharacterized protein n=1 Tax=Naganishia vaughanmartiniae TaxID=1424756 RepID=A0ACC2XM48_9TREE|nr:hypothetical protein QFC22_000094 [Naganishia vaughanmartiniae]